MVTKSDLLIVPFEEYIPDDKAIQPREKEIEMEQHYPSIEQDEAFVGAFEYLNEELFDNQLPVPMLVLTRNPKIRAGHFAPDSWTAEDGTTQHEIALNANVYAEGNWKYAMTVLVHEMLHLEQWINETYGRPGYHNKKFCAKLKELGVLPIDPSTGEEITNGDRVSDRIIDGGNTEQALMSMPEEYVFPYLPKEMPDDGTKVIVVEKPDSGDQEPPKPRKRGVKVKYNCAVCGNNMWGKSDMLIHCQGTEGSWHELRAVVEQQ